ncbi:MAG: hypothetical protein ACC742_17460, partial [Thermoanaerobaculales bacterium]
TKQYESLGMSQDVARRTAKATNEDMARCILALYRSAAQPAMSHWGRHAPQAAARRGLVIIPTEDHYTGGEALARRTAERAQAHVTVLDWATGGCARTPAAGRRRCASSSTRSARPRQGA